jgi:ABC-type glycerol-3-phosphate transport system substrate-binding protein
MSKFQLILTGLFALFIIGGVIAFAAFRANKDSDATKTVLWGTVESKTINKLLADARITNKKEINVDYVKKNIITFEQDLVEALAKGAGPDMILLPHDLILSQSDKAYIIPYKSFSERLFKDTFIQGSELFLSPGGVIGLPFSVDPIVMYWNRDIFVSEGLPKPPKTWDEFFSLSDKLTKRDVNGNITQSIVALGDFRNVLHAKEILTTLTIQSGDPIIILDKAGRMRSVLGDRFGTSLVPAEEALRFFTEFANPSKTTYSWNRSLPDSLTAFLGGKLAVYFGYASEISSIRDKNPNLNFDVATLPQIKDSRVPATYGDMQALVILKSSPNITASYIAVTTLVSDQLALNWSKASGLPPTKISLLLDKPTDAYKSVFYNSAIITKAWFDPSPRETSKIFSDMVDNVTSGKLRLSDAVREASASIGDILRR